MCVRVCVCVFAAWVEGDVWLLGQAKVIAEC